jgi:hypothetical protein
MSDELQRRDPRRYAGELMPIMPPSSFTGNWDEQWRIEAWNDGENAGSCSTFGSMKSMEEAIARAERFVEEGDYDGRKYDHVEIAHIRYVVCARETIYTIDEAKAL